MFGHIYLRHRFIVFKYFLLSSSVWFFSNIYMYLYQYGNFRKSRFILCSCWVFLNHLFVPLERSRFIIDSFKQSRFIIDSFKQSRFVSISTSIC